MRIFIALLFSIHLLGAQKVIKKSILNTEITSINIDANNCFELSIETTDDNEMVLGATIEGEYKKNLLLNTREDGSTILVSAGFQPNFRSPNDKLSAHKVVSIAVTIKVPRYRSVRIYGTSCNVTAQGSYRTLEISLNDGTCTLNNVSESVEVNTQSGDIILNAVKAEIKAKSKYGNVRGDQIPKGDNQYKITTVKGEISINKTD